MGINKVVFGNQTLVDLTEDTVTASDLKRGITAHDRSGNPIVGTSTDGGGLSTMPIAEWTELTTEERQAYGLIGLIESDSGFIRGRIVNGADYVPPFAVKQIYDENTGSSYTWDGEVFSCENFPHCGGIVLTVSDPSIVSVTFTVTDISAGTPEAGTCNDLGSLPTLTSTGANRLSFHDFFSPGTWTASLTASTRTVYIDVYRGGGFTCTITPNY